MKGFIKKTTALYIALGLIVLTSGFYFYGTAYASCGSGFSFCRTLTVNHTKVPSTQTNFTILATSTDATFATAAHSGNVQNTVSFNGQTVPADMVFSSTADCSTLMSWDFESYDATAGTIVVWILIPSLSSSADTNVYMCYGKSSVSTYQGGSVGAAWDSDYLAVWHLANGSTLSALDSTGNTNNGTINSATAGTGQIDGDGAFSGSSQYISMSNIAIADPYNFTVEAWVNPTTGSYEGILSKTNNNFPNPFDFYIDASGAPTFYYGGNGSSDFNGFSGGGISSGVWTHLVATEAGSAGSNTATMYKNGSSVASQAGNVTTTDGNNTVYIATRGDLFTMMNGGIDEVRISKVARSTDWITTEYNNQSDVADFLTVGAEQAGGGGVISSISHVAVRGGGGGTIKIRGSGSGGGKVIFR